MSNLSRQELVDLLAIRRPKEAPGPLSLNPYRPIGMKVCRICWNFLDNETAYCRRCGHSSTCFLGGVAQDRCFRHNDRRAEHVCNYCVRSFCTECLTANPDASLCFGGPTYCCYLCSDEM